MNVLWKILIIFIIAQIVYGNKVPECTKTRRNGDGKIEIKCIIYYPYYPYYYTYPYYFYYPYGYYYNPYYYVYG